MAHWFHRNYVGRSLSDREQRFVTALSRMLDEVRPAQLDRNESSMTSEGQDLITLLPHRALGGVSIVASFVGRSALVQWAQVHDLRRWHDDLDAGVTAVSLRSWWRPIDAEAVVAAVRGQLNAPIRLSRIDDRRAVVSVRDHRGVLRAVGTLLMESSTASSLTHGASVVEAEIRMTDVAPPQFGQPSNALNWFGTAEDGA